MSEQEQHEIIGKTVVEHRETKRKLAALEAKARTYAASMRTVARELHPSGERLTKESVESLLSEPASRGMESYPNRSDVEELFAELRETKAKLEELGDSLRQMGLDHLI